MIVAALRKDYFDPLTSLKLFTEGKEFDRNIWWKLEYECDNNGNKHIEKSRELHYGKPPIYVPKYISYMPAIRK